MQIDYGFKQDPFPPSPDRFRELATGKVRMVETGYDPEQASPVFTVEGSWKGRGQKVPCGEYYSFFEGF